MAIFLLKRTNTADKRPDPLLMAFGELDLNYEDVTSGIFYKNSSGTVVKVGPAQVSATAPNAVPAGSPGNSVGEFWYDTSTSLLKIWTGSAWTTTTGIVDPLSITEGATVPANTSGNNGDLFLLTTPNPQVLYQKVSGTWVTNPVLTNLATNASYNQNETLTLGQLADVIYDDNYGLNAALQAAIQASSPTTTLDFASFKVSISLASVTGPDRAAILANTGKGFGLYLNGTATTGSGDWYVDLYEVEDFLTSMTLNCILQGDSFNNFVGLTGITQTATSATVVGTGPFSGGVFVNTLNAGDLLVRSSDNEGWTVGPNFPSFLQAGSGISVSYNASTFQWTVTNTGTTGDITGVTAGIGLSGGGTSGDVTLNLIAPTGGNIGGVKAGTNITIAADGTISAAAGGTPAGANTEIQFNNSGSFGANSGLTFTVGTGVLTAPTLVCSGPVYSAQFGPLSVTGQNVEVSGGQNITLGASGGSLLLHGGDFTSAGPGTGTGGTTSIRGGSSAIGSTAVVTGGNVTINGGAGANGGADGTVQITTISAASATATYVPTNSVDLTTKSYVDARTVTVAGPTNAVQYNSGAGLGGEAAFSYDATSNQLTVASILGYQGNLFLTAPPQATTGFPGNSVVLNGGIGLGAGQISGGVALLGALGPVDGGDGGPVELLAGNGRVNGDGGDIVLTPGAGAGTGVSGTVRITEISVASATPAYTPTAATDLTTKSYVDGKANPAGSTTQVQYNNAGAFGASSAFTFTSGSGTLGINAIQGNAGVTFSLSAAGSGSGNGSNASLAAGSTSAAAQGGDLSLAGGNCNFSGNGNRGGNVSISGGFGAFNDLVAQSGGNVSLTGGNTLVGKGGSVTIVAGGPTGGSRGIGGDVVIASGTGGFASTGGNVTIDAGTGPSGNGTVNIYKINNAQATATYTPTAATDLTTKSYVDGLVAAPGTVTGAVNISNATASTSKITGALTVAGGVGVSGDVYANAVHTDGLYAIGTNITAYNDIVPNTASSRSLGSAALPWQEVYIQAGSLHLAAANPLVNPVTVSNAANYFQLSGGGFKILDTDGTTTLYQVDPVTALVTSGAQTQITNVNNTTGVGTGSFQTAGGAYVAKDLVVTGNITANNLVISAPNYATIISTATQTNPVVNTANVVTYSSVEFGTGITIASTNRVVVSRAGVYNFVVSLQVKKSDGGSDNFDLWFGKNGTYIPNSTSHYTLVSNTDNELIAVVNFALPLVANDYIQLFWSSADPNIFLLAETGLTNPTRPDVPSVILTITEVK